MVYVEDLQDIDFVDAQHGWVAGSIGILATADGGTHWSEQDVPSKPIIKLDFISPLVGWAVGVDSLLGTADGGRIWTKLVEPGRPLADITFVSPTVGWGVSTSNARVLPFEGSVVKTTDGGRTWSDARAPVAVRSVCANTANSVWAAGAKDVLHSADAGATWSTSFTLPLAGDIWSGKVWCVGSKVAWAQFQDGVATGHEGHVIYRTLDGGDTWEAMMRQAYTVGDAVQAPDTPGDYPGPISVVDAQTAFVMGSCPMCGGGTTTMVTTLDGGATWGTQLPIPSQGVYFEASAAKFISADRGWVVGAARYPMANTTPEQDTREYDVFATTDGGSTWTKQYP